mmetsp:Transcript_38209/g.83096  ORF Transcript_38209/g.83096 Transcript_38209/m.83096 type:complete len:262 (+) Transcript_38209:698-1483(+)
MSSRCDSMLSRRSLHRSTTRTFRVFAATLEARFTRSSTREVTTSAFISAARVKISYTSRSLLTNLKIMRLVGTLSSMQSSNCPRAQRTVLAALSPVQSETTYMGLGVAQMESSKGVTKGIPASGKLDTFGSVTLACFASFTCLAVADAAAIAFRRFAERVRIKFLRPLRLRAGLELLGLSLAGAFTTAESSLLSLSNSEKLAAMRFSRSRRSAKARFIVSVAATSAFICCSSPSLAYFAFDSFAVNFFCSSSSSCSSSIAF